MRSLQQRALNICLLWMFWKTTIAQGCTADTVFGENNPQSSKNNVDSNTDLYYLICSGAYAISCCGTVNQFQYYAKNDGTIQLMVWRPGATSGEYDLVGSASDTVSGLGGGGAERTVSLAASFLVQSGDCIGWYTAGTDMVTYKTDGSSTTTFYLSSASVDTTTTVSWAGASSVTNNKYAVNAQVVTPASPVFASTTTAYTIADTTGTGVSIAIVTFTDTDAGDTLSLAMSGTDSLYYAFTDNGDKTGLLQTSASTSISALSGTSSTLTFTATDDCGNTATGSFTITISNDPPTLTNLVQAATLSEDITIETSITSYTCSDASDDVQATVASITPSNSPDPEFFFSRFESGSATSSVYGIYARSQSDTTMGTFNYNSQRDYVISIECTDTKDTVTDTITIDLLQNQPPNITNIPSPTSITVSQTVRQGDIVFTTSFTDNEGDTVSFSYVCSPTGCPFDVLDSGEIQATANIDSVTTLAYDMTITVSDSKNSGTPRKLTIVITDGLSFTNLPDTIEVQENTANPSTIFIVSYTGVDASATATLSTTYSSLFAINSSTAEVGTISSINYEALSTHTYALPISLSDGRANISSTLTIYIIDVNEALAWSSSLYRTEVNEGVAVGTTVTDPGFAITDPDTNDTYSCTMDCGTDNGYFSMSTACVITVTSTYSLDAGLGNTLNCTVTAVDEGPNTATTTLIITVVDTDNYTPTFETFIYTFSLSAYSGVDTQVGTVNASDLDAGAYGQFTYSLNQTLLPGNYFKIGGSGGIISTQVDMPTDCACSKSTFTVLAYATDTGGLVGTATVYITMSEYTTVATTTTTDRNRTFFEDPRNIGWFALTMGLLAATAIASAFVILKYVLPGPTLCKGIFRGQRYNLRPERANQTGKPNASNNSMNSVRNPPPPKAEQAWRNQRLVRVYEHAPVDVRRY